jgi:hypothetical protein
LVIDLLDHSRDKISADELDHLEEEEGEWKEEQMGITDYQDYSDLAILLIANNVPPSDSPSRTFKQED